MRFDIDMNEYTSRARQGGVLQNFETLWSSNLSTNQ